MYTLFSRVFPVASVLVLLGQSAAAQVVEYFHLDALGSVRAITNASGTIIEQHDYMPFGEEWCGSGCSTPPAGQARRFTGKERDTETGLDYFGARYYGSRVGRFTTVDPAIDPKGVFRSPQLWNRYAYARSNPLRYIDPDGRLSFEADPSSKEPLTDADIERARDAQKALRDSLTMESKAYFRNQFSEDLEELLADDRGPVVRLSKGTLTGRVGECKNGPGCRILINLDYATADIQAGFLHELGHHLDRAGGQTYPNTIFDQKLDADSRQAAAKGGTFRLGAVTLVNPDERASYYAELYQFKRVRTFWAEPVR